MRLVILDTQEILTRYMTYDHLFNFYPDGIRDLIKAAVLEAGHQIHRRFEDRDTEVYWMRSLAGRAAREWEYAIDQALSNGHQLDDDTGSMNRYRVDRDVIQLVTEQIEEDVDKLIQLHTESRYYQVKELPTHLNVPEWIGNALVVQIGHRYED